MDFITVTQQAPYLASLLHLSNIPRQLRSSISQQQLIVPKTKLNLGKHAFSVAVPRVWNELPITLKTSETISIFRKKFDVFIPNCISTINLQLSLVLIMTCASLFMILRLTILVCCRMRRMSLYLLLTATFIDCITNLKDSY